MNILIICMAIAILCILTYYFDSMVDNGKLIIAAMTAIPVSFYMNINTNASWLEIGAQASKLFISVIILICMLIIVVHCVYYIKKELFKLITKFGSK